MPSVLRQLRRHVQRFEPCLPRPAKRPPAGKGWIHEIKHDGFRIMAWRKGDDVRLLSRKGYDLTDRFRYAAAAMAALPVRSCLIDAEAIACNERGLADFELIRSYRHDHAVTLCAFDLLEIDGGDLRRESIEKRKDRLRDLLRRSHPGIAFNEHYADDGAIIYKHACALGCEGIVSKRLGSPYRSGRSHDWIKVKNPVAPAVRREAQEDWA
jgi:bifunctional non-homologous end joining protein LigD